MSEDSGLKPQLPDYVVEYLAALGTTPEYLAQHYPNTYDVFATHMSRDEIKTLDKVGAGLALDPPKGDNHKDPDANEDADATQDPGEKLKKYLSAVH
jgi:hypothetical protein